MTLNVSTKNNKLAFLIKEIERHKRYTNIYKIKIERHTKYTKNTQTDIRYQQI